MGVEHRGRRLPRLHVSDDCGEVRRLGVSAGEQRGLALVELGVGEDQVIADDAQQDVAATVADIV